MKMKFSRSFKLQAVEKVLKRSDEESIKEKAQELGIGFSTLTKWMRDVKEGSLKENKNGLTKLEKRPGDWLLAERMKAVIDSGSLTEQALGRYCREQGLFPHQLKQWKQDLLQMAPEEKNQAIKAENRQLKEQNKQLKRELHRKEKALAEAAALLILKKKAEALWGSDEDE